MNNEPKKKSKGKIIAIVICAIIGISVIGYAAGGKNEKDGKTDTQSSTVLTSQNEGNTAQSTSDNSENKGVSKVVYNKNGIKITYKGIENSYNITTSIKFLIENNNSESYTVQTTDVTLDNYTMSTIMSTTVAAGKKSNDDISVLASDLKDCGLSSDTISSAEIGLVIWGESDILNQTKDKITFSLR